MTDIKEPINTTSDGTFLSVVCENPEKSVVGQKLGGGGPQFPQPPQELPPCIEGYLGITIPERGQLYRSIIPMLPMVITTSYCNIQYRLVQLIKAEEFMS